MSFDYYACQESKMDEALQKEAIDEPHLAYLWYEAIANKQKLGDVRNLWGKQLIAKGIFPCRKGPTDSNKIQENLVLIPDRSKVEWLPPLSFILQVPFKMRKPYISKDDRCFYLIDNPLCREKVFQDPMVAASAWKGALRAAMVQQLAQWWGSLDGPAKEERGNRKYFVAWRCQMVRIFGTEQGVQLADKDCESYLDKLGGKLQGYWFRRYLRRYVAKNGFLTGRLIFYPSFFHKVSLEVINSHDYQKGIGLPRGPIFMECVPKGESSILTLVYVPAIFFIQNEEKKRKIVARDLEAVAEGIKAMLTAYGFGAKTSSGFGIVADQLVNQGSLVIRCEPANDKGGSVDEPQLPPQVRYLESPNRLIPELRCPDNSIKSEVRTRITEYTFRTLEELCDQAKKASACLRGGKA